MSRLPWWRSFKSGVVPKLSAYWNLGHQYAALFFLVFGLRMWVSAYAGSPIPFYDQWLLSFKDLAIVPSGLKFLIFTHNEHRLITTLCVEKLSLWWNGYYDVRTTQVAAAIVRAVSGVVAFHLAKDKDKAKNWVVLAICSAIFAIPYSAYNALNGMQFSMYCVDLSLLCSIWILRIWREGNGARMAMMFAFTGLIGIASLSHAVLVPLITVALNSLFPKRRPYFWTSWAITALGAASLLAFAPPSAPEIRNQARPSFLELFDIIGWPVPNPFLSAAVIAVGSALFCYVLRKRKQAIPSCDLLIATALFSLGCEFAIALKRPGDFGMRHYEAAMPLLPSFIAVAAHAITKWKKPVQIFGFVLMVSIFLSPLIEAIICYRQNHLQRDEALTLVRFALENNKMEAFGEVTNKQLLVGDLSFFYNPILQYSPGLSLGSGIDHIPFVKKRISPEILPIQPLSALSQTFSLVRRFYPLYLILVVVFLIPAKAPTQLSVFTKEKQSSNEID